METSRKIYLTVLLLGLTIGLTAATQYVAAAYGYNPRLGFGLLRLQGITVYLPFAFLIWLATIYNTGPNVLNNGGLIFLGCAMAPFLLAVILTRRKKSGINDFAKRAWATLDDARAAGVVNKKPVGVIIGKWTDNRTLLSYDGPEHQLVAGASRAGKGAGHVVPTLLAWPGSVFVYDPKEECYDITGRFRSQFSHTFFLNFTRLDSASFNPLAEIRRGNSEVADIQNIATILADPSGLKPDPNFFDLSASSLLYAIILHQLYAAPDDQKNLAAIRQKVMDFTNLIDEMAGTQHRYKPDPMAEDGLARDTNGRPIPEVHPEVRLKAVQYLRADEKLKTSIVFTVLSYLDVFADPLVAVKTSQSDFMIGDLMCSEAPVSCYFQTPPSDAPRLQPLTRLVLSQIARSLMTYQDRDAQGRKKNHKLLFLIDEFPSLGRLGFFSNNLRVMAGYGLKAHIIVQSFKDIISAYGRENTILDNCHITVAFASADNDTSTIISGLAGKAVDIRTSESRSSNTSRLFGGGRSKTFSEQQRHIIEAGDVRQLPYDEQLIFITGTKPMRTKKIRYWLDKPFKDRATDIKTGGRGPDQSERIDVPRPGAIVNPWYGIAPAATAKMASPAAHDEANTAPVADAAQMALASGLNLDSFADDVTDPE